ncbi:MAG: 2-phospho-L-lactate guanylyltransferase [Haloarculaceae archaeon]
MRVVVPFGARNPKTRLAEYFSPSERTALARAMLDDVLAALERAGHEPRVLSTAPLDVPQPVTVDERPLTEAVNAALDPPTAVVMADLALATPEALDRLFAPDADVVLAPGLGGGTNALVTRTPAFEVDYHGASYRDHREAAEAAGASLVTVDSFRLATDVDEPADLAEVLLHADPDGRTRTWLTDAGVELAVTEGRVTVTRADA